MASVPRDRRFAPEPEPVSPEARDRGPHFLLMSPRTPANCGLAARAIKNFGFRSLSLVALPRLNGRDYFGDHARGAAWKAFDVLRAARTPPTLAGARAGLTVLIAVDPEPPPGLPRLSVEEAATLVLADPDRTGLLFGRESSGLTNEELDWATHALVLPSAPDYPELNLAQSVLLVAAEIHRERIRRGASAAPTAPPEAAAASYEEIERLARRASVWFREIGFSQDLESDDGRRFRGAGWRPARGLLRMLLRARPRKHEIALLLGVLRQARIAARQKET